MNSSPAANPARYGQCYLTQRLLDMDILKPNKLELIFTGGQGYINHMLTVQPLSRHSFPNLFLFTFFSTYRKYSNYIATAHCTYLACYQTHYGTARTTLKSAITNALFINLYLFRCCK